MATTDGVILAALHDFVGQCINSSTGVDVGSCVYTNEWQKKTADLPAPVHQESLRKVFDNELWEAELELIRLVEDRKSDTEKLVAGYVHLALQEVDQGKITAHPKLSKYIAKLREIREVSHILSDVTTMRTYALFRQAKAMAFQP